MCASFPGRGYFLGGAKSCSCEDICAKATAKFGFTLVSSKEKKYFHLAYY